MDFTEKNICVICGKSYELYGNSTWGLWDINEDYQDDNDTRGEVYRCCDKCNLKFVVPARMGLIPRMKFSEVKGLNK